MSRNIKRHPVELLVSAFLKKLNGAKLRQEKNTIDKLAKLIGTVLHDPCCPEAEEVTFSTPKETYIVVSVVNALNGVDVRKWRDSLERTKKLLEDSINDPCCD